MRQDDPGFDSGTGGGVAAPPIRQPIVMQPTGAVATGTADQLASLITRAVHAPTAMVHLIRDGRLLLYGSHGLPPQWLDLSHVPLTDSVAGVIMATDTVLCVPDVHQDPRVPAASPILANGPGAYLGVPIHGTTGAVVGICAAYDTRPRAWTPADIAAVDDAAQVGAWLVNEQVARQAVEHNRRFLDAVLDSLHEGVTACDADGRIVLVNARMKSMWGDAPVPADLDDPAAVANLYHPDGRPLSNEDVTLLRAVHGERVHDEEVVLQRRGRNVRHYLIEAMPILGSTGRPAGAVMGVQDVTRRRRAERFGTCELAVTTALAEARSVEEAGPRVLEAVVGTLGWAHAELWLVDAPAQALRPAARWTAPGWRSDIAVPDRLPHGQGLAGRAWQAGKPLWIRDVGRPQSLISRKMAVSSRLHTALAIPVRNGSDSLGVLTAFADTIEDPEGELVALMSGIAAHIGQFLEHRLVEDLQRQLVRSKDEYLALIGHELRTPLTSISAYTGLLREADHDTLISDGPALLEVIDRNTAQLRHIIDELLELSALDTGHAAVQAAPVDIAAVVRESADAARAAVAGKPLTVTTDLPDQLVVPGDHHRLRQVVDNLLDNAVRYSPDGGQITVTLRAVGGYAELTVADTGIGIAPEERDRLFAQLYRTSRARDRAIPGTGLGLTLSRAVIERHHGTIELASHQGPGTTIVVRLPLDAR
ncbi:MAG TPA: ATP-binding protein [Actinoplanes sp.]|nr:ATP-binding protein [Actinoplanes sp.]